MISDFGRPSVIVALALALSLAARVGAAASDRPSDTGTLAARRFSSPVLERLLEQGGHHEGELHRWLRADLPCRLEVARTDDEVPDGTRRNGYRLHIALTTESYARLARVVLADVFTLEVLGQDQVVLSTATELEVTQHWRPHFPANIRTWRIELGRDGLLRRVHLAVPTIARDAMEDKRATFELLFKSRRQQIFDAIHPDVRDPR